MSRSYDLPAARVEPLFEGPLDIVGDVHGEWIALQSLLAHLGYDARGSHASGRRLVFVGDLCDRGPDSPAVLRFVRELVERAEAQCVLGNHEINLLRNERKRGNGWYFEQHPDHRRPEFADCRRVGDRERDSIRAFISQLPLALQRPDLRVVHAAWHDASLQTLLRATPRSRLDDYLDFERIASAAVPAAIVSAAQREKSAWHPHLRERSQPVPLLSSLGLEDSLYQMGNPLRVLTSGPERVASRSYFAGGKWRMVERVPWWQDYRDSTPVVIGHYWRWISAEGRQRYSGGETDLFGSAGPLDWLGPARSVFCVDYSVGARFQEILDGYSPGSFTRLAALRWPERVLVDEHGRFADAQPR